MGRAVARVGRARKHTVRAPPSGLRLRAAIRYTSVMQRARSLWFLLAMSSLSIACGSDDDADPAGTSKDAGSSRESPIRGRRDARVEPEAPGADEVVTPQPSACALDAAACPECKRDQDCEERAPCYAGSCNADNGLCEARMLDDGSECARGDATGVCVSGACVECDEDEDCSAPDADACAEAYCDPKGRCGVRTRVTGSACEGGFCNDEASCVQCATDANCGEHARCRAETCECEAGFVANTGSTLGCNLDECATLDDNHCATAVVDNECANTDDGYSCSCNQDQGWKLGGNKNAPQCYLGGDGATFTVPNGATWNVVPGPTLVCSSVIADPPPAGCPLGDDGKALHAQLSWLNLCVLGPPPCTSLAGNSNGFLSTNLQRTSYSAALQDYGDPDPMGADHIDDIKVGDVILVQTLTALHAMRITTISNAEMTYEWATLWRDHCAAPGGATCLKSCGCEGGK